MSARTKSIPRSRLDEVIAVGASLASLNLVAPTDMPRTADDEETPTIDPLGGPQWRELAINAIVTGLTRLTRVSAGGNTYRLRHYYGHKDNDLLTWSPPKHTFNQVRQLFKEAPFFFVFERRDPPVYNNHYYYFTTREMPEWIMPAISDFETRQSDFFHDLLMPQENPRDEVRRLIKLARQEPSKTPGNDHRLSGSGDNLMVKFSTHIVGIRHYPAHIEPGEPGSLVHESTNPHDRNAVRVNNALGDQVGHVPREHAVWLAPLLDAGVRADLRAGGGDNWRINATISLYGPQKDAYAVAVEQHMRAGGAVPNNNAGWLYSRLQQA